MKDLLVYQPSHRNERVPMIGVKRDPNDMTEQERLDAIREIDGRYVEDKWELACLTLACWQKGEWTIGSGQNTRPGLPQFVNYMNRQTGRDRSQSEWTTLLDVAKKILSLNDPSLVETIKAQFLGWSKIKICLQWMTAENAAAILRLCKDTKDGGLNPDDLRLACVERFASVDERRPYVEKPERRGSMYVGFLRDHKTGFIDDSILVLRQIPLPVPTEAAMWLLALQLMKTDKIKWRDHVMVYLFKLLAQHRPELAEKAKAAWSVWLEQKGLEEEAWPLTMPSPDSEIVDSDAIAVTTCPYCGKEFTSEDVS